jgi:regulator of protease activity HflC (stomatin/prohibitin superfamily)
METTGKPQTKKVSQPVALVRMVLIVFVLVLFFYFLWRGGVLALLAWIATVVVLIDTSVNVLFGIYSETGSRPLGFMYWLASVFLGAQGTQVVTREGKLIPFKPAGPLASIFSRMGGPGMLIIENGVAVVLERSGKFTRVHGPGVVWTQRFERVVKTVDLRRQVRTKRVDKIMTRDGLTFDLDRLDVMFDLATDFDPRRGEYAFSEEAMQDLVFRGGLIYREKGEEVEWGGRVLGMIEVFVRNVAANMDLLQIVKSDADNPRERFVREVEDRARPALRQIGIRLVGIDIGHITGPEELRNILVMPYREQAMLGISQGLRKAIDEVNQAMSRDSGEARPHLLVNLTETLGHLLEETLRLAGPHGQPNGRALLSSGERAAAEKEQS